MGTSVRAHTDALPLSPAWTGSRATMLILGLFVLAVGVRLIGLGSDPVWFDEAATLEIAALPYSDIFGTVGPLESSPPGFYALARLWVSLVGEQITLVRLLPALAGALTILPVWFMARDAYGDRAAMLCAAMLALTASHVRLSQDARTYTALCLLFACALLLAERLTRRSALDRGTLALTATLGVIQGGMLWLHGTASVQIALIGIFLVVAGTLGALGLRRTMVIAGVAGMMAAAIGALPLLYALAHVGGEEFSDRWIDDLDLIEALRIYGRTLVAPYLHGLSPVAGLLQAGLVGVAVVLGLRRRDPTTLGLVAALGGLALVLPLMSGLLPIMLDRTILFMLIPLQLLVAAGAARLPRPGFAIAAVALLALNLVGVIHYNRIEVRKEQWPAVAAWMSPRLQGEPILVTEGAFAARALALPFAERRLSPRIIVLAPSNPLEELVAQRGPRPYLRNVQDLCRLAQGAPAVWAVSRGLPPTVAEDPGYTARPALEQALRAAGSAITAQRDADNFVVRRWTLPGCTTRSAPAPR